MQTNLNRLELLKTVIEEKEINEDMFIFKKVINNSAILVILNLGENELEFDNSLINNKEILISNYKNTSAKLRAYESIIVKE